MTSFNPEIPCDVFRQSAISALAGLAVRYYNHDPSTLNAGSRATAAALQSVNVYYSMLDSTVNTYEDTIQSSFLKTTVYYDAGFRDPIYLDDVANDWLMQDMWQAEEAGFAELADTIKGKIFDINKDILEIQHPAADQEPGCMELGIKLEDVLGRDLAIELAFEEDMAVAVGTAFTSLIEAGIEDPEALLIERGILQ